MASTRDEMLSREVTRKLRSALDRLRAVWSDIGLEADQRANRTEVVVVHLNNILEEMVAEEEQLRDRLLKNIDKYGTDLLRLSKELSLPPYEPPEGLTNVRLEKNLRQKVSALEHERKDRMKRLAQLKKEDQHLCDIMLVTPYYIATGAVPSQHQLKELEDHINGLKAEKEQRYTLFQKTKHSIVKLLDDLEQCPNSSFERELVCEEDESFLLTSENMSALKQYCEELERRQQENFARAASLRERLTTLWDRLEMADDERNAFLTQNTGFKPKVIAAINEEINRCEVLKLQNMRQVIEKTRLELVQWWDKCYYSQAQRQAFAPFSQDVFTEESLDAHEREVDSVKQYFETNKTLLDLVERWQTLFNQFLEMEKKDPNRYFNRGCNLLKEEKARKKLQKELPRVEDDVKEKIEELEAASGRAFLVEGTRFVDYIQAQWDQFRAGKENEKTQRHEAKLKLTQAEMKYGSRPTTPGKKRGLGTTLTPGRTPTKKFRPEHGPPVSLYNSTASSTGSSLSSTASRLGIPPAGPSARSRKGNDTTKTPTNSRTPGINRTARNNTAMYSPVCLGPRSTQKPKPVAQNPLTDRRPDNESVFSATTVSSQPQRPDNQAFSQESSGSIEPYKDFARSLNQNSRTTNCRSSILPEAQKPVFF